jgi:hypothetical protein
MERTGFWHLCCWSDVYRCLAFGFLVKSHLFTAWTMPTSRFDQKVLMVKHLQNSSSANLPLMGQSVGHNGTLVTHSVSLSVDIPTCGKVFRSRDDILSPSATSAVSPVFRPASITLAAHYHMHVATWVFSLAVGGNTRTREPRWSGG